MYAFTYSSRLVLKGLTVFWPSSLRFYTPLRIIFARPWFCNDFGERFVRHSECPCPETCITLFPLMKSNLGYTEITESWLLEILTHPRGYLQDTKFFMQWNDRYCVSTECCQLLFWVNGVFQVFSDYRNGEIHPSSCVLTQFYKKFDICIQPDLCSG